MVPYASWLNSGDNARGRSGRRVPGFVAAAVAGPWLQRDRYRAMPSNLLFVALGAGILWLGWNGFNGGDPYFAGADATAAIVNASLAAAVAMMTWMIMDMSFGREKKPAFLGGLNGMIAAWPASPRRQRLGRDPRYPGSRGGQAE